MSKIFEMSGIKFGNGMVFKCEKKSAGAPIAANMTEMVTRDDSNGKIKYYNCSIVKPDASLKTRENYITSFILSGPNGGPNNGMFNGPSGMGNKGSLFNNCKEIKPGKLPSGNPENLTMIQQYGVYGASACEFHGYYSPGDEESSNRNPGW